LRYKVKWVTSIEKYIFEQTLSPIISACMGKAYFSAADDALLVH
jgi:hypothetical protein